MCILFHEIMTVDGAMDNDFSAMSFPCYDVEILQIVDIGYKEQMFWRQIFITFVCYDVILLLMLICTVCYIGLMGSKLWAPEDAGPPGICPERQKATPGRSSVQKY